MSKPNFFIVGAPKCGTTSMYEYLKKHPDVFMSIPKEPHHFSTDLNPPWHYWDKKEYLGFFKNSNNRKGIGEASATYLYSKIAAKKINKFNPKAKIIIMLRNPVDLVYSLHSSNLFALTEDIQRGG